jgi:hypothetical protein
MRMLISTQFTFYGNFHKVKSQALGVKLLAAGGSLLTF